MPGTFAGPHQTPGEEHLREGRQTRPVLPPGGTRAGVRTLGTRLPRHLASRRGCTVAGLGHGLVTASSV